MLDEPTSPIRPSVDADPGRRASAPADIPAESPLWAADEVRAAVASSIERGQVWIAVWGVSWLARRGHEVEGPQVAWAIGHAPPAALVCMFGRIERGARLRAQPALARAIADGLASLWERDREAALAAELAFAAHLGRLAEIDDSLIAFIEGLDGLLIQFTIPDLARNRDPRAGALLRRIADSDHDTEIRTDALIALARRGDIDAVAAAAPALLAIDPADIDGSIPFELAQSIERILELLPLRERHRLFLYGADRAGEVTTRQAAASLTDGCDPDTARRLGVALPPRAAERVHRSLRVGRSAAAWKLLIPGAARAAELAAAESPRFASEARAIGALIAALAASGFPEDVMEEEQDGLCEALVLIIAHLARAHRVDDELADPAVGPEEARALLRVDLPWVEDATIARARALLSMEENLELAERASELSRRNAIILRALADPDLMVEALVIEDAYRIQEPPLEPTLQVCSGHFGEDAFPALARQYGDRPTSELVTALHESAARLGTERARAALRAFPGGGTIPKESFAPMILLAMDLRDAERAREITASLAADPSARLLLFADDGALPDSGEIRRALAEMLELAGAGGQVDEVALAAIAARTQESLAAMLESAALDGPEDVLDEAEREALDDLDLDAIAADDEHWDSFGPDPEFDEAMRGLASIVSPEELFRAQPPPGKAALDRLGLLAGLSHQAGQADHGDSCGPGCGHSHAAPVRPLHRAAKVGRNDPCPCGSGKKHKHCCGG